jgi:hypothetical protein
VRRKTRRSIFSSGLYLPPAQIPATAALSAVLCLLPFAVVLAADKALYTNVELTRTANDGIKFTLTPDLKAFRAPAAGATVNESAQSSEQVVVVAVPPSGAVDVSSTAADFRWDGPFSVRDLRIVRVWLPSQQSANVQVRWSNAVTSASLGDDPVFEPIYRAVVLNYDQSRSFRARSARAPIDNPFARSSEWYRVVVTADGPHRITQGQLSAAGFPVSIADPRDFRMYYAGGRTLPVPNSTPRPQLHEIAIEVTGETDGDFGSSDAICFFGQSTDRWQNDDSDAAYITNEYTRENVYWLVPDATDTLPVMRIATISALPGADLPVSVGIGRAVAEQDRLIDQEDEDFFTWFWQDAPSLSTVMNLPGAQSGAGTVTVTVGLGTVINRLRVRVNGTLAAFQSAAGLRITYNAASWLPNSTIQLSDTLNQDFWLDRLEVVYPRALVSDATGLEFWLPGTTGDHVRIRGVSSGALLWDITNADSPLVISGDVRGDTIAFNPQSAGPERRYRVWTRSQAASPASVIAAQPGSLRQSPSVTDMLMITHPLFTNVVASYRSHREAESGISTDIISVSDIYDDFGFGLFDPVAIRDFLKYTYQTSSVPPSAALLVGDGSYDFQNHTGAGSVNYIPPFVVPPNVDRTAGDQLFVSFGPHGTLDVDTSWVKLDDRGWDMMIARWPVRSPAEAQIVANKIARYESEPEFGLWRNRILLVADDEIGSAGSTQEFFHTEQAEGQILPRIDSSYNVDKVYLFEYPRDAAGDKPLAREELVRIWNEGMLLVDYVGHGSPDVWAHEAIFRRGDDVPRLFNRGRLPLVYTASCSIGLFDHPSSEGMGEELLRRPDGGAIAIISATRLVFSAPNVDLNAPVLSFLVGPAPLTTGQALYAGLIARQYSSSGGPIAIENDRKHILFGDPFMFLARADLDVRFDTASMPDSLIALTVMNVTGQITDSAGAPENPGGRLLLSVLDAPRARAYTVGSKTVNYTLPGRPIFDGTFAVSDAAFDLGFIVPKDVSYGADGARIVVYVEGDTQDALGVLPSVSIAQVGATSSDNSGPVWDLTLNGQPVSGTPSITGDAVWRARITDPLGINIGGGGHGISVAIDGREFERRDITSLFRYDLGSFSTGTIEFSVPELTPGSHDVNLLAWDNANNPAALDVSVEVLNQTDYKIKDFLVYPNPFNPAAQPARLTYELPFAPDRVEFSVFTVAGKRVRTIADPMPSVGYNYSASWDGRDDVGDPVAAGVYLLAIEVQGAGQKTKEFTKIVVIRSD